MSNLFRLPVWRIILSACLVLFSYGKSDGQNNPDSLNLVPNSSFEDINICKELNQPCSPSAWFFLSRRLTTGYFPRYPSATGNRHLQLVAVSRETVNRQYWETMLICPLKAGERYLVDLKIAGPANKTELMTKCPNLRDIGLWFTTKFLFVQGDSLLQPREYFSLSGASVSSGKNGWFEVKKEFVPTSDRTILIVGNFARGANADIIEQRNFTGPSIDILVDDISVTAVKGGLCANHQRIKDSLYAITRRHSDVDPDELELPPVGAPVGGTPSTGGRPTSPSSPGTPGAGTPTQGAPTPGAPGAPVPGKTDTIVLRNIQFDFDHYLMQNSDTLQRYRSLFTKPGIRKIHVVGFTDDTGPESYNLDLSKKRSQEVARWLSGNFHLSSELFETEGRGISRTYPTKELNRRVEIYILHY